MKTLPWLAAAALSTATALPASAAPAAAPIRIASWNLGWHVSEAEYPRWLSQCGKSYAKSAADGVWRVVAEGSPGATVGWFIKEPRSTLEGVDLSQMPPCGVYEGAERTKFALTDQPPHQ